jgi:DNA-binding transcriptional LysR family regulator
MSDLDALETFVTVVRLGNFTAAAGALRLPRSTVSQRVARLEASLGVRLLERTTRSVRPTPSGTAYYERCARILAELEEANAIVKDASTSPRGMLRVASPLLFGQSFLARIAAEFIARYPAVSIEIVASHRSVNLLEDNFDIAIEVATAAIDSSAMSRLLSGGQLWCCAAPAYVRAHGVPTTPEDLANHECVVGGEFQTARWAFERGGDLRRIDVRGRLVVNTIAMAHEAALAGAGIASIPRFLCEPDLRRGKLKRVLADWVVDRRQLRVVFPSGRHLSTRVRLFVELIVSSYQAMTKGRDVSA